MRRKKIELKYKKERVVFSDVLPYETPLIFSNRHFYRFLVKYNIRTEDNKICWDVNMPDEAFECLKQLFGINGNGQIKKSEGCFSIKNNKSKNHFHTKLHTKNPNLEN